MMTLENSFPMEGTKDKRFSAFLTAFQLRPDLMKDLQTLIEKRPDLLFGEHHWRTISENGTNFSFPETGRPHNNVVAFSRILSGREILCAINLHHQDDAIVYVTLDNSLHPSGSRMTCLYASAPSPGELNVEDRNGKAVRLTIPPGSLVVYG
ncbi:alpha amylase C-terminal domain-containing protein [Dyadobacter endophyticus]|uniref:alpha amylase C-terminal domain-containing protein n=2 Tax=Spirosomataceae TaxID=2896860 RepID=UPI00166A9110|nr:alpha amylase C-terminal domain-containing protein [Dyadobacter endophyticus]